MWWICCFLVVCVYAEDYPYRFTGKCRGWESDKLRLIALFLPEHPTIVQAGAHYGDETQELAGYFSKGRVFALEPNPHAFEILQQAVQDFPNVAVHPAALHSFCGKTCLYVCHGSFGDNPIFEHVSSLLKPTRAMEVHYQGPRIHVPCTTLDDFCKNMEIDLLRLDVRGSELHTLAYGQNTLQKVRCIHVHTNLYPFREGTTLYPDLEAFLKRQGFALLAHWYRENLEGDAIFVRKSFLNENVFPREKYSLKGQGLRSYVKRGSLVIDIGAQSGQYPELFSSIVGPRGAVLCFMAKGCAEKDNVIALADPPALDAFAGVSLIRIDPSQDAADLLAGMKKTLRTQTPALLLPKETSFLIQSYNYAILPCDETYDLALPLE